MDRRQTKTKDAIFKAFIALLSKKHFNQITVSEIIERANIARATFYAHFETKDFLLKALCEELFCHITDAAEPQKSPHTHIFDCDAPSSAILHLLQHLEKNDNHILDLFASENDALFLRYFKENLSLLLKKQAHLFEDKRPPSIPEALWANHIVSTFVETVGFWIGTGRRESAETVCERFLALL